MPDPRFDGSLDAPTFVDRQAPCTDCGQLEGAYEHDERNADGHFYNTTSTPLLRPVLPTVPASTARPHIVAQPAVQHPPSSLRVDRTSRLIETLTELHAEKLQLKQQLDELRERHRHVHDAFDAMLNLVRANGADTSAFEGADELPARPVRPMRPARPGQRIHLRSSQGNARCAVFSFNLHELRLTDNRGEATCLSCRRRSDADDDGGYDGR